MKSVAFVTSEALPDLYSDDLAAVSALATLGIRAVPAVWSDRRVRWEEFDLVVLRSPWDWYENAHAFEAFLLDLERRDVRVENSRAVRFLEKSFLRDAENEGARLVPTEWVEPGDMRTLAAIVEERGWNRAVFKPSRSANAHRTVLFDAASAGAHEAEFRSIVLTERAMVQPFFPEVQDPGEWALLFFDGQFSHALRKVPRRGDFRVQSDHGGTVHFEPEPPGSLIHQATKALEAVGHPLLYARVDGVVRDGLLYIMELELVEPELFLRADPDAPMRFATAIAKRLR